MTATIAIATGGTGGHVFPALAVARALRDCGQQAVLLTDARGRRWLEGENAVFEVPAASPSGSPARRLRALWQLVRGTVRAHRLFGELRPAAAAAFGGYASLPAVVAAWLRRVPIVVHEQNAVLGRANRFTARFASLLLLSFEQTDHLPARLRARTVVTGNPVRPDFVHGSIADRPADGRLRLLVTGGSQGAQRLGEVLPAAVARLPEELRRRLVLWLQARPEQVDGISAELARAGLAEVEVRPFFTDLSRRLAQADLVVGRAGASTLAELLVLGKPAVLVPFPYAADDHQTANARRLEATGAALCLAEPALTPATLADTLASLLSDPGRLERMRAAALRLARPDAARQIARTVLALLPKEACP